MGKFADKQKEILGTVQEKSKGGKLKRTFSQSQFDTLGTALLNDPEFEDVVVSKQGNKYVEKKTQPVKELRKALIGSVAKAAGVDAAETQSLITGHEFPTLPLYQYTASLLEGYLDAGKSFAFEKRSDLNATLTIDTVPEITKTTRKPGPADPNAPVITTIMGEHRKVKVKSSCPPGRKTKL